MQTPIIEVRHIGKRYNISHHKGGYLSLRDVFANILQRPLSFLKSRAKRAVGLEKKEDFWALKDVSFNVNKGEIIGVIGRNGAGKSTLLKILTGITPPTKGEIVLRGRVASLLEVGTGFHPELTGRENIYLNGAILGMTSDEITRKFDEIVAFAGIAKFLDTPVKFYSSGMYVRLGFSIAAHLEPDILLVDEVLAVGDTEFQKKCLGKMEEVTKQDGRTILFVSHNMSAIQNLCTRTVLLNHGQVEMFGDTDEVIKYYLESVARQGSVVIPNKQNTIATIEAVRVIDGHGLARTEVPISDTFTIDIDFSSPKGVQNATLSVIFYTQERDLLLYSSASDATGKFESYAPGSYSTSIEIPAFLFNVGLYSFDILLHTPNEFVYAEAKDIHFEIQNVDNPRSIIFRKAHAGKIAVQLSYQTKSR